MNDIGVTMRIREMRRIPPLYLQKSLLPTRANIGDLFKCYANSLLPDRNISGLSRAGKIATIVGSVAKLIGDTIPLTLADRLSEQGASMFKKAASALTIIGIPAAIAGGVCKFSESLASQTKLDSLVKLISRAEESEPIILGLLSYEQIKNGKEALLNVLQGIKHDNRYNEIFGGLIRGISDIDSLFAGELLKLCK